MTEQHPTSPPPELVREWASESLAAQNLCNRAAQWGYEQHANVNAAKLQQAVDAEFEACLKELESIPSQFGIPFGKMAGNALRAARRPKQPSLKEQALAHFEPYAASFEMSGGDSDLIRRALEALPDA